MTVSRRPLEKQTREHFAKTTVQERSEQARKETFKKRSRPREQNYIFEGR